MQLVVVAWGRRRRLNKGMALPAATDILVARAMVRQEGDCGWLWRRRGCRLQQSDFAGGRADACHVSVEVSPSKWRRGLDFHALAITKSMLAIVLLTGLNVGKM